MALGASNATLTGVDGAYLEYKVHDKRGLSITEKNAACEIIVKARHFALLLVQACTASMYYFEVLARGAPGEHAVWSLTF